MSDRMTEPPVKRRLTNRELFWARVVVRRAEKITQRYIPGMQPYARQRAYYLALLITCHAIYVAIDFERMAKGGDGDILHDMAGIESEMWRWPGQPDRWLFLPRFNRRTE